MINGSANSRIGYIDGGLKNDIHEGCSMQGQAYKVLEGAQKTCIKTKILILRNSDQRPTTNPINIYDNRKIIMMCLIQHTLQLQVSRITLNTAINKIHNSFDDKDQGEDAISKLELQPYFFMCFSAKLCTLCTLLDMIV